MQNLSAFALFLLFALAATQDPSVGTEGDDPEPEECIVYKVLNGSDRAQGNTDQNNVTCDQRDLATPGWYRFRGDAGDRMPEKQCVPMRRCGTHAPGWLNGSHPTVDEGAVQRQVCYHWSSNCCRWSNNIRVRNCGGFFVYELQRTPTCYLRYCGNAEGPTQAPPTTPPAEPEECKNYKVLDGADRAQGNANQNNVRCDQRDLATPGWYRFQGDAGDRMPENQCVPMRRCGTHAPGWLNGSHPTVDEGAVQRKVCYHWSSNCCRWSNNIRVRNCGVFFVYELQRTPTCYLRYCGNAGAPTPPPPTTPPVPFGQGFTLLCLPRGIQVRVPRDVMRDWGRVHLNDPRCDVQDESDTHVVLKTPLDGCGTVRRSIHGRTVYTNNVIAHPQNDDDDDDEGGPPMNFPFMCNAQTFERPTERADEPMRDATEESQETELLTTA